jgi:hypothetical protein
MTIFYSGVQGRSARCGLGETGSPAVSGVTLERILTWLVRRKSLDCCFSGGAKGTRTPALTRQFNDLPAVSFRLVPVQYRSLPAVSFSGLDGVKSGHLQQRPGGPPQTPTAVVVSREVLDAVLALQALLAATRRRQAGAEASASTSSNPATRHSENTS